MAATSKSVAKQVRKKLKIAKLVKVEDDRDKEIDDFIASIDLSTMDNVADQQDDLLAMATDSGQISYLSTGLKINESAFEAIDVRAAEFAKDRAAEMVGKKWEDGELVDNASAEFAITESTRNMLRSVIADGLEQGKTSKQIADDIADIEGEDGYVFSEDRAEAIADYEINNANGQGALAGMKEAQDAGVVLGKYWYPDSEACPICLENADDGVIDIDDDFSSGDDSTPAHLNCECVILTAPLEGDPGDSFNEEDDNDNE